MTPVKVPDFNPDNIEAWIEVLNSYLILRRFYDGRNSKDSKATAVLKTSIGVDTTKLLMDIVAPKKLEDFTYDQLVKKLIFKFKNRRSSSTGQNNQPQTSRRPKAKVEPKPKVEKQLKKTKTKQNPNRLLTTEAQACFDDGPAHNEADGFIYLLIYNHEKTWSIIGHSKTQPREKFTNEKYQVCQALRTPFSKFTFNIISRQLEEYQRERDDASAGSCDDELWLVGDREVFKEAIKKIVTKVKRSRWNSTLGDLDEDDEASDESDGNAGEDSSSEHLEYSYDRINNLWGILFA